MENENSQTEMDVDTLYETAINSNEGHGLIDDSGEPVAQAAGDPTPQAPVQAAPTVQELEFSWNGKPVKTKFDDPRVKQWASQGYDYAQRMQAFNQEKGQWETKAKEYDTKYKPIDEWARQNPEKWQSLYQQWEQQAQVQAQNQSQPQQVQLPPEVQKTLQELVEFKQQAITEKQEIQVKQEDAALNTEIESVRKQYPDIDFNKVDEHGKSLEFRVLEYANQKRIPTFSDAFLGLHHKELLKQAEERGKTAYAQNIQKNTKLGIIGKSPTPTKQLTQAMHVRDKSYGDLVTEALEELGT